MKDALNYLLYITLLALLLGIFWLSYVISSALIYFYVGYILLPFVVISSLYFIYWLWKWLFSKSYRNVGKSIILAVSYIIFLYLLVKLDTYSWDGESNFYRYLSLFKWIIDTW